MLRDVLIIIKSHQSYGEDSDSIELTTNGKFGTVNGEYLISYADVDDKGKETTKTSLHVKKDGSVVLNRTGEIESKFIIKTNERVSTTYITPQGTMLMGIFGEAIKIDLNENGGKVKVVYNIDSNLQLLSKNTVEIIVKEVNKNVSTSL